MHYSTLSYFKRHMAEHAADNSENTLYDTWKEAETNAYVLLLLERRK